MTGKSQLKQKPKKNQILAQSFVADEEEKVASQEEYIYAKYDDNEFRPLSVRDKKKRKNSGFLILDHLSGKKQKRKTKKEERKKKKEVLPFKNNVVSADLVERKHELLASLINKQALLSNIERKSLWILCNAQDPQSEEDRKKLWLVASGAANQLKLFQYKNYYESLKNSDIKYPNPSFNQIELDLKRTFQDDPPEVHEKYIPPLRNVLYTYVKRNPTVGYCQGMNFIVGRLVKLMNEEEAFWTTCMILETILPLDYYSNMIGVLIDQRVFYILLKKRIPEIVEHLDKLQFDPSLLAFQWFVCFFTYNLPLEILDQYPKTSIKIKDLLQALQMRKFKISLQEIEKLRTKIRPVVEADLQKMVEQKDITTSGPYPKLKFINKFYLYNGMSKYLESNEIFWKTMDQFEQELMKIFDCDTKWPICLFDFTYKNKIPQYFCFKIDKDLTSCVMDNYFAVDHVNNTHSTNKYQNVISLEDLLIERNTHLCTVNSNFVPNFKLLFNDYNPLLFNNHCLQFSIRDEQDIMNKTQKFIKEVSNCKPDIINRIKIERQKMEEEKSAQKEQSVLSKSKEEDSQGDSSEQMSFAKDLISSNQMYFNQENMTHRDSMLDRSLANMSFREATGSIVGLHRLPSLHMSAIESAYRHVNPQHQEMLLQATNGSIFQDIFQQIPLNRITTPIRIDEIDDDDPHDQNYFRNEKDEHEDDEDLSFE